MFQAPTYDEDMLSMVNHAPESKKQQHPEVKKKDLGQEVKDRL